MGRVKKAVLGIVPARAGSKGLPAKNTRSLAGRPLLWYTLAAAAASRTLNRTILSTDSQEIAIIGRTAGVEVPFLRPAYLAADDTPMVSVVHHALEWLSTNEWYQPDIVVLLQPTTPLREARHIDEAVRLLIDSGADSVVSVTPVPGHYNPHWQFCLAADGTLRIFTGEPLTQLVNRRQDLPVTYTRNGAVYAFWRRTLEETGTMYGQRCLAYVMPADVSINIDDLDDWLLAEAYLKGRQGL